MTTNETKIVQITPDMTLAELEALGCKVAIFETSDTTPLTTALRYGRRDEIAEIYAPSNWLKSWNWQSAHFGAGACDYEMITENIGFSDGGIKRIIALPAELNELVNVIETAQELGQFLSEYFGEPIEILFCGYGRQNKGRAPIERKIETTVNEYHRNKRA